MAIEYRFLPWTKRGLSRAVLTPDAQGIDARPKIDIGLTIAADQDGKPASAVSGSVGLRLFGPGDVLGIDTRLILRSDPKPFATNFEPNYLALVDFDPPDFVWMFTPAMADANNRLRPWLVLLVFDRRHVALPKLRPGLPLPTVVVPQDVAELELPDLAESWMWAHAQATTDAATQGQINGELMQQPERNASRLISPRRLEASHDYFACIVPAFDIGCRRGLGLPLSAAPGTPLSLQPAWSRPFTGAVELPVYYHWQFSTGPSGDFEALARRIKTPSAYAGDADLAARLKTLGTTPMAIDADRLLTADATPVSLLYEGALTSVDHTSAPHAPADIGDRLQTIVNAPQTQLVGAANPDRAPTVAPPIYGAWHARKHVVDALPDHWLADLNRDPRFRAAAGKGTAVVQAHQEALMDACWGQVGEVLRTERALAQAALAKQVLRVLHARLTQLPDHRFLAVAGPAQSRIRLAPQETVLARIRATSLPNAISDPALRRLTSAQRPTLKAAVRRATGAASVATQISTLVHTLVKASLHPDAIDPNRYVPDGILGSKIYEHLQIPADPAALIDLASIGLTGTLRADQARALQAGSRTARDWYSKRDGESRTWRPTLKPVRGQGLLTELHFIRFAQLSAAATPAARVPIAQIATQMHATGAVRLSEGVLVALNDQQGQAVSTLIPLRIDGRTGAIQPFVVPVRAAPKVAALKAASTATTAASATRKARAGTAGAAGVATYGTVVRQQISQFGNTAIFATLPVNSLPLAAGAQPVAIGSNADSALAGLFRGAGAVLPAGLATVTVPAPLHDKATLDRFSAALKEMNQLWRPALDAAGVSVKAVDFPLAAVATEIRRRTDPALTVPARLSASLSIGGAALQMDTATHDLSNPFMAHVLPASSGMADIRYVVPLLFDRVMAYPKIEEPMSVRLAKLDAEAMMPGANAIPNDFLVLAKTNNRFVESFMVGINHEMAREMLWRGFPTDQRGTPMRRFWDRLDDHPDIREIHTWNPLLALGSQPPPPPQPAVAGDRLVLVIRATLIKRFPNLTVYARRKHPSKATLAQPADFVVAEPGISLPASLDMIVSRPIFAGPLPPDLVYIGFDIVATPQEAAKWCFVLEEQMTEPRFGFDEAGSGRVQAAVGGWKDVTWDAVTRVGDGQFLTLERVRRAKPASVGPAQVPANSDAARIARALLQRPFRAYFLGATLVT